jgi:hypothetical protein
MDHQKGLQIGASPSLLVTVASSSAVVVEAPLHVVVRHVFHLNIGRWWNIVGHGKWVI